MMCFVGLLNLEHHLVRHFHHHLVVYLNLSQDTLELSGRLSTIGLMRTKPFSPFVAEPSFLNVNTATWAFALSMFIMVCLTGLMATISLVPFAVLSMNSICIPCDSNQLVNEESGIRNHPRHAYMVFKLPTH